MFACKLQNNLRSQLNLEFLNKNALKIKTWCDIIVSKLIKQRKNDDDKETKGLEGQIKFNDQKY